MPEEDDLPRVLSGRYRLEATLGHGGMGVVYRGSDLMMMRPIAIKLVRGVDGVDLDDEIAGRFLREAKNTARLQHEHIIEVYDLGRADDGSLYFVMELLEGESLSVRLRREGKLSPEATVHIGRQICQALQVAHAAGVIHRDLKPANVMLLSRAGDENFVKVLDFGVAKSLASDQDTQLTHTGMLVGTVDYMAPEQITGKPVDGRTDIYALGVVLYRMLSGQAPFRDTGVPALIHAHLNTMPKPLMEVTTGVPNPLDHVVLRCLAKDPARRFESMGELARALATALAPDDAPLMDLEYGGGPSDSDPYGDADATKVARSFDDDPLPPPEDPTVSDAPDFDDATIKIDRPLSARGPATPGSGGLPMTPRSGMQRLGPPPMQRPLVGAEESSMGARSASDELRPLERGAPKTCAMCQTVSPPHARACGACGVSLSSDEQDAVRARVLSGAPSAVSGPPTPGRPSSGPYAMPGALGPAPQQGPGYGVPSPMHGVPQWLPHPPPAPPSRSMWQRFLAWTGLRGR